MPALYHTSIETFVNSNADQVLGTLSDGLAREGFDISRLTTLSWLKEISDLQSSFLALSGTYPRSATWPIFLEYVLPIVGQRVDCIILADNIIVVIEYKSGESTASKAALRQAQQYALNLSDFHEASRGRTVIPIAVGSFKRIIRVNSLALHEGAAVTPDNLAQAILEAHGYWANVNDHIDENIWNNSRYFPVPSIIEAATAMYAHHDVKNLAYSRSGNDNLESTQNAIAASVRDAKVRAVKKLIVVTGVPGAGKTLAGLNAVQQLQSELDIEHEQASFLSGNGPLVAVLQEALKRSIRSQKKGVSKSIQSRIREVHRFVRDTYGDNRAPADRLIVFDEAQRAWTAAKNEKKFSRNVSEPEMVLEIMGRHHGWAVVIALVGGGQEIHGGEAGLAAWGDAITKHSNWEVTTSPEALLGGPAVAGSRLFRTDQTCTNIIARDPCLHLAISKRSYETEVTAAWVNAVLDERKTDAACLAGSGLPIHLTRDLDAARHWLRTQAKGERRAGLIASSGAARLRAEGVETPTFSFLGGIDYAKWFLEPEGDHRSSNQLEVALSEFELQGLEIDLAALLWGGDLIFPQGRLVARTLRGKKWCEVSGTGDPQASADDRRTRIQNKYRVLLTRFRKGMVIFVPEGSLEDTTRAAEDFDSVYEYLLACGVRPL